MSYYDTRPSETRKIYLNRTHCPYCERELQDDFFEMKEKRRIAKIKEGYRLKRERGEKMRNDKKKFTS